MLDFHKNCAHHETWTMNMSKKKVLYHRGLSHFFRGLQSIAPYTRHPKSSACHAESSSCPKSNSTTVSQNAIFNPFKTSSKFTKYCACHTKWRPKAPLILTPANVLATCRKCHACHTKWTQPKNEHSSLIKQDLRSWEVSATQPLCASLVEMHMGYFLDKIFIMILYH